MGAVLSIIRRELTGYFTSSVAYVFLFLYLLLTGFFTFMFSGFFAEFQVTPDGFLMWQPWLYVGFVPAIGMRLWAEERRHGTLELLFTLPVTVCQAVIGKFLSAWIFMGIALALTFPFPCTLYYLGHPDAGVLCTGYLGCLLVSGCCLTVSCATSAVTRNQVISFVTSVFICLILVLAGYPPVVNLLLKWGGPNWLVELLVHLSLAYHFESLKNGVIDFRDMFYFVSVMYMGLSVTHGILENRR